MKEKEWLNNGDKPMINTKDLKDGDRVFIGVGNDEMNESDPLIKLFAIYRQGIFVVSNDESIQR